VTEFLPISSSGHLILIPRIFRWADFGLAFDAILHLATAGAILVFFRKEIGEILWGLIQKKDVQWRKDSRRLTGWIILSAIPAGVVGLFFESEIEHKLRGVGVVAWALIIGAFFLFLAEKYSQKVDKKIEGWKSVSWGQALAVGISQVLALVPGVSRSGATIAGGLFSKMDRKTAVRLSFLVGLPAIFGAGFLELIKVIGAGELNIEPINIIVGFLSAYVAGIFSLKLLLWLANKANFNIFVVYRIALGIILLMMF
jgi:undecaprenyl-diphosphatase